LKVHSPGGQHAEVLNGNVDSLTLGEWTLCNLPVGILPLRQLPQGLGVKHLDGCIGTNVLYHFLAALDYPHGQLVLRKKKAQNDHTLENKSTGKSVVVPIWMAGNDYMVGWGPDQLGGANPALCRHRAGGRRRKARGIHPQDCQYHAGGRQTKPHLEPVVEGR
jgi:hypothetical protein